MTDDTFDRGHAETAVPGDSVLDAIRRIQSETNARRILELPVWWSDQLDNATVVVRFRVIDRARMNKIASTIGSSARSDQIAQAKLIAEACDAVMVTEGDTTRSIDPSGEPVRFDRRLAGLMGYGEVSGAVEVVERFYKVEGPDGAPGAIAGTVQQLAEWMSGNRPGTAETLGESSAAA